MGPQVQQELLTLPSTCVAFLGTVFFFLSFLLLAMCCLSFSMNMTSDYLCLLYLQTFLIPRTGAVVVVIIW